jgi:hypothetical protein
MGSPCSPDPRLGAVGGRFDPPQVVVLPSILTVVKLNEETYKLDQRILALLFLIDAVIVHSGGGRRCFRAVAERHQDGLVGLMVQNHLEVDQVGFAHGASSPVSRAGRSCRPGRQHDERQGNEGE